MLGHYVAYRKLVSPSPSDLLPSDRFRLYAVAARFPQNLAGQVPWQELQSGVYDCRWGLDVVRVIVAGQLPRAAHNAPLHLFSASPELVGFGQSAYRRHSDDTSTLLRQLFERLRREGFLMSYTMEDFRRDYAKEHFPQLTAEEQREALKKLSPERLREVLKSVPPETFLAELPPETRVAGLSPEAILGALSEEQVRQLSDKLSAGRAAPPRKPRRKR